ncbi:uncharacterized protein A1O9_05044 [Exophiala aquamarina CBS 119918]|uniref:Uncharacterized protein n=1 Tax=Exophiala aquamarina CBS 119918 TaxID=1182545 RepID=A0A072PJA3_9EURO|nr:uncharacterized protein A1O9_05044 [Exophiala aquamarina CBS 119918]KEF60194.1 hypothetical protein A1O9_05044 [Exophiala aquamarina CBS 119918]
MSSNENERKSTPIQAQVEIVDLAPAEVSRFNVDEGGQFNITLKLLALIVAIWSIYFASIIHIVAVAGGGDKVTWITLVLGINPIIFGPH